MIKATHPEPASIAEESDSAHPGWWTALAVIATAWFGIPMVLPIAAAVPWILFRRRRDPSARRIGYTLRWALATLVTGIAMVALAGDRAIRSIPFGERAIEGARAWVGGTGGAVPPLLVMAQWTILFALASVLTRGILGGVLLAHVLLITALHAAMVFASSLNVVQASVVAFPIWSVLLLAGMTLLLDPLASWGESRFRRGQNETRAVVPARRILLGAVFIAAAFAARLVVAGPLTDVLRRLTTP
jgi:hypothetical protein